MEKLIYQIALTLVPGIGDVQGKKLVSYCGGVEAVFREKKNNLLKIEGVGEYSIRELGKKEFFEKAEKEIKFIEKYKIQPLFYYDRDYPSRLKHCPDSPLMLYYKGSADLNSIHVLGVVGTRRPTEYGKEMCAKIIEDMSHIEVMIISGLAYGIDACSHKAALMSGLPTIGVLAHGLDTIYPHLNRGLAEKMIHQGGLLTEFISETKLNKDFFPRRNRVIAGMSDAVLVVESAGKGGALITADIANSYNRDVFALPGRRYDKQSKGCNALIKTNRAALIESAGDIISMLSWEENIDKKQIQKRLFINLSEEEKMIMEILHEERTVSMDVIYLKVGLPISKVASLLLKLEFDGLLQALPGKIYKLI